MALAHWQQINPLPALPTLAVMPTDRVKLLADMAKLSPQEVTRRLDEGHTPYIALMEGVPAAYGWAAHAHAEIGELDIAFDLPRDQVYLWDFATLPQWRGLGIYPHLLQGIVQQEAAAHFWIIYAPENYASSRGIQRAGFAPVGELSYVKWQAGAGLHPLSAAAYQGADLLHIPLADRADLASCWCCTMQARAAEEFHAPGCWSGVCACTQRPA